MARAIPRAILLLQAHCNPGTDNTGERKPAPRQRYPQPQAASHQAANRRRHPATSWQQPIHNDNKRQGREHNRCIAAGHATAVLAFTRQKSQVRSLSRPPAQTPSSKSSLRRLPEDQAVGRLMAAIAQAQAAGVVGVDFLLWIRSCCGGCMCCCDRGGEPSGLPARGDSASSRGVGDTAGPQPAHGS
jgi:hypothetical protein